VLASLLIGSGIAGIQMVSAQEKCPDVSALEAAAKAAPTTDAKALVDLGQAYLCTGRFRDAQFSLEEAIRRDYKSFEAHFHLGRALYEQGDYDAALLEYGQLASLYPDRLEPYYQQGVVSARVRKPEDAIKAFTQAIEVGKRIKAPDEILVSTYLALASQYRALKNFDGVATAYASALELRSGDAALMLGRAQALFDAGKPTDALPIAFEVRKNNPSNTGAVLLIADIYSAQGLPERALREIDDTLASIKTPKERAELFVKRGVILQKAGRNNEAIAAFTAAADANPESWEAQYNIGVLLLPTKPADALARFKNALRIKPDDGDTQLAIATAHDAMKNYTAAYAAAKTAAGLLSNPAQKSRARFLAARSAYNAGQYNDASTELRALVAAEPENYAYQLWYGLTRYQLKDTPGAVAALETAVKLNPTAVEARTTLGAVYFAARRFADAEQVLRSVLSVEPNNVDALTNLGFALANLNRTEEACTALAKATALGSSAARQAANQLKCR
jgi:tetratricopeptide (TPR) repeat protein